MRAIRDRLRDVYGIPHAPPHGHPIAELILTVLSQSTNDRNRDVAYLRLRERFPGETWTQVRDAPVDVVEEAIRPGGISRVKSARIRSIFLSAGMAAMALVGSVTPLLLAPAASVLPSGEKAIVLMKLQPLGLRQVRSGLFVARSHRQS